jgi:hypothetical protein
MHIPSRMPNLYPAQKQMPTQHWLLPWATFMNCLIGGFRVCFVFSGDRYAFNKVAPKFGHTNFFWVFF